MRRFVYACLALPLFSLSLAGGAVETSADAAATDQPAGAPQPAGLTLAAFLDAVRHDNRDIRSAHTTNLGLDLAAKEPLAAFSPNFNADVNYLDNNSESALSALSGSRMRVTNWDLGLSKLWGTGTFTSIGYKASNTLIDYPPAVNPFNAQLMNKYGDLLGPLMNLFSSFESPDNPYFTSSPTIMVSQSLWKNFMARGATVTLDKVEAQAKAGQIMNDFAVQQTLFSAESTYVMLAVAREAVTITEESLNRNNKILEWAKRRAASNLGDQVDVLQTQAAIKQLEMGLTQAREDVKAAERSFNNLRGLPENTAVGELETLTPPETKELERKHDRADIEATRQDLRARELTVDEVIERYKPDLSVFASASFNGFDDNALGAYGKSLTKDWPTTMVGAKFTANIDFPLIFKVIQGAKLATESGDESLKQKNADLDRDWANLKQKWSGVLERLAMADELEALQKEKAEREKVRFANGRTTNFQVLRFEDDYAQARLTRLRLVAEARITEAQARLYNGE